MYELFVLGELLDAPTHGYKLHQIVTHAIGPIRQLSWGALYPLLLRLEQQGFIVGKLDNSSGGRERKLYHITEAGEARFQALMAEPGAYNIDYPDLFSIKLHNFYKIELVGQLTILRHFRGYIQFIHDSLVEGQQHVAIEPEIHEPERQDILRSMDHRLYVARANLQWLDAEIARRTGEQIS